MRHQVIRASAAFQLTICAAFLGIGAPSHAQSIPAFSGAEGFGGTFTGSAPSGGWFSNAAVYHVTTTADILSADGKGAPGTLRGAFIDSARKQQGTNVIVVFDVGGVLQLTHGSLDIKTVNNYYIAGQTAPSPVVVYGDTTQITHSNNTLNSNLILRYMTFRRGLAASGNTDSLTFAGGSTDGSGSVATNMIIDHASTSWATDEDLSVANNNTNVTVQYSIIADSLRTDHAYGSLIRTRTNTNVTYAHNLYANNLSRNPRPGTYNGNTNNFDFENNVIYNWKNRAGYTGGASENDIEHVNLNYVGNYAIAGPSTPAGTSSTTAFTLDTSDDPVDLHVYQSGNAIDADHGVNPSGIPNGTNTGWGMFIQSNGATTSAFPDTSKWNNPIGSPLNSGAPANTVAAPAMATQTAVNAYNQVANYAGNFWWSRDPIDARIIGNVQSNTNPPNGVAADAPDAAELNALLATPTVARPANWDSDGDGMPDLWETAHGLNPTSAADGKLDFANNGYVNAQKYLDEIGAFPAPGPIVFTAATNSRYAQITNWNMAFQPSRLDEVQINAGTAVVDAVGQHAGVLKIAANPNDTAQLNMTSGWLQVAQEVDVGTNLSNGMLNLSGGDLSTPVLNKGNGGTFSFTGGKLHAGIVTFNLVNQGGVLAPGNRTDAITVQGATPTALSNIGQTHVTGNLALASGSVEIELASATSFDIVSVDGLLTFGGSLQVLALGGYTPTVGSTFDILDWGSRSGLFSSLQLPSLGGLAAWNTTRLYKSGELSVVDLDHIPGDFNRDHQLTAADLPFMLLWLADIPGYESSRGLSGDDFVAIADLDGSGVADNADIQAMLYMLAHGNSFASSTAPTPVPEPPTGWLAVVAVMLLTTTVGRLGTNTKNIANC